MTMWRRTSVDMTIVVCPLSRVAETVAAHRPERVISMLNPEWTFPELGPQYAGRHLRLSFHDIHVAAANQVLPSAEHVRHFLRFIDAWDDQAPILIHCRAGISRSTAAAFIAACYTNPHVDEHDMAAVLRRAAPFARPNQRLVELADRELRRNGRMREAIEATGRELSWTDVEEGEPFRLVLRATQ
jgi:predicted protein tyrosine phosphatase